MNSITLQENRAVLRHCGFPLATTDSTKAPNDMAVWQTVVEVLEDPSVRAVEAVTVALLKLVSSDHTRFELQASNDVCRRMGFMLEEMSQWQSLPASTRDALETWASAVAREVRWANAVPIPLSTDMTDRLLNVTMRRRSTALQRRWQVYGRMELRQELLAELTSQST